MDELNQHECMPALITLLNHLTKTKISPPPKQVCIIRRFVLSQASCTQGYTTCSSRANVRPAGHEVLCGPPAGL